MKTHKLSAVFCALVLLLSGCSFLSHFKEESKKESYADGDKYLSEFEHCIQYQSLNKQEKLGYRQLYTAVKDAIYTDAVIKDDKGYSHPGLRIPLDVSLDQEGMSRLYEAFLRDHPRFFFMARTYSLEGYQSEGKTVYNTLVLRFTMSQDQRKTALTRLDDAVDKFLANRPQTDDDYLAEKYIHDRLLKQCTYDEVAAGAGSNQHESAYSAYGALVEGKAVCEGYAKAMQLLLNQISIPATVVMGYALEDGEPHMWNLVEINGKHYYLDPTWNDDDDAPQYAYFNLTSEALLRTHSLDEGQPIPADITATADNYFVRNGTYIDTYERDVIAQVIARRIQAGDTAIHLQFAKGKYENALLFLKNLSLTRRMTNNHLNGTNSLWYYDLSTHAKQCVISLVKAEHPH